MKLIIDIGNSCSKVAFFEQSLVGEVFRYDFLTAERLERLLSSHPDTSCGILSCVGSLQQETVSFLKSRLPFFMVLNFQSPVPIVNAYETPESLGNDRLAAAVAGHAAFPNDNVLVIDAGTCITYDFVDFNGVYHGGAIAPGIDMRYNALFSSTALLPKLYEVKNLSVLGQNTSRCIQSGVVNGMIFEIEGFIDSLSRIHKHLKVIFTGGYGSFFANSVKFKTFVRENMVLEGLNIILQFNENKL